MIAIRSAQFPDDREAVLAIWREYVASPVANLDHQNNEGEFADLPGKYGGPNGRLIVADQAGQLEGCVALRPVSDDICEMKRLYVRPRARGHGVGFRLVERLIMAAGEAGFAEIRLDVLAEFERAHALYRRFGFVDAEPVTFNPVPGTVFLGLRLLAS